MGFGLLHLGEIILFVALWVGLGLFSWNLFRWVWRRGRGDGPGPYGLTL